MAGAVLLFQKYWIDQAPSSFDPAYPAVNAQGDPIFAVYEGRTPCPDCQTAQMVKMQLVLYHNRETATPTTYWLGLSKWAKATSGGSIKEAGQSGAELQVIPKRLPTSSMPTALRSAGHIGM